VTSGRWFSEGTPVSSTNKTDSHNITEILLKVALNTITLTLVIKRITIGYVIIGNINMHSTMYVF
jgi:hypothetical protein